MKATFWDAGWTALLGCLVVVSCAGKSLNHVGDVNDAGAAGDDSGSGGKLVGAGGKAGGGGQAGEPVIEQPGGTGAVGGAGEETPFTCEDCELVAETPAIRAIWAASDRVYWIEYGGFDSLNNYQEDGRLMALPFDSDEPVVVASDLEGPIQLRTTEDYGYVILDRSTSPEGALQLAQINLGDGAVELLQSLPVGLDGYRSGNTITEPVDWFRGYFTSSPGYVFWLSDGTIYRLAEGSGAAPESFLELGPHPGEGAQLGTMLADDSRVFLQDGAGITSVLVTGGTREPLWTSSDSERYGSISVVGDYFFAHELGEYGDAGSYFARLAKAGGSFKRLGQPTLEGGLAFHPGIGSALRTDGTRYVGVFRAYSAEKTDCMLVEGLLEGPEPAQILAVSPQWRDEERRYREDWRAWDATATTVYLGYQDQLYRVAREF